MNTFKELVMANRSRRGFDESRKVERGELETLVDYTRYCAASANIQPLKYYLSCDRETNSRIQPLTGWAKGSKKNSRTRVRSRRRLSSSASIKILARTRPRSVRTSGS